MRRCRLKIFLIWSSGGPFVQRRKTICAIWVEGQVKRNNSVKLFYILPVVQEEMSFKRFLIWSSGSPSLRWSKTICAISKKYIMGNIYVKMYEIWTSGLGGDFVKRKS